MAADVLDLPRCWRLNRQLALLFAENPGLHMEFIGLVLPDPCWEGRPALGGKLQAWPQCCSSFQLQLYFVDWGLRSQCFAAVRSGESIAQLPGLFEEMKRGGKNISDQICLSEALKGKATLIRSPLENIIPFLGLWPWRRWQVLPPHSALSLSRGVCWQVQSQVSVQYQPPNIFYGVASGCFLRMILSCQGPLVLSGASAELPGL